MRLSCNFVNVYTIAYRVQYTFTCVHARIHNGHPREDFREEKRACRTSRRGSWCVSGSWQAERGSHRTRRHPRDDTRAEVGEDVRVGVRIGPVEFQLKRDIIVDVGITGTAMVCVCMCIEWMRNRAGAPSLAAHSKNNESLILQWLPSPPPVDDLDNLTYRIQRLTVGLVDDDWLYHDDVTWLSRQRVRVNGLRPYVTYKV